MHIACLDKEIIKLILELQTLSLPFWTCSSSQATSLQVIQPPATASVSSSYLFRPHAQIYQKLFTFRHIFERVLIILIPS